MNTLIQTPTRRILMCVSGMSAAIITETLYALLMQDPPFVPDEIHVVTTSTGKEKIIKELLTPDSGHFHRLMQDYLPGQSMVFNADTVHVISEQRALAQASGVFAGLGNNSEPEFETCLLDDIVTDADNKAAADSIYRVMWQLKNQPNTSTQLHASVAGGRKSMSFYMGHAFSLLAEPDDILSHVLVNEPFENPALRFYYPPLHPEVRTYTEKNFKTKEEVEKSISTSQAGIKLAELSVLKLGGFMGSKDWPVKAQKSFEFAVKLAQAALEPPELLVVLKHDKGWLEVCGEKIKLSPQEFAVFALHALVRQHQEVFPEPAGLELEKLSPEFWDSLGEGFNLKTKSFKPVRSKIQAALREVIGPVAQHFTIEADSDKKKNHTEHRLTILKTAPERIQLEGLGHWLRELKTELGTNEGHE